jgi:PAS domain-containing protein
LLIGLLSGEQRRKAESLRRARDELADTYRELQMTNKALRLENTMRGQAEAALRESEQRFRDFAETGSDWLWETGPDHQLTQISAHIQRLGVHPAKRLGFTRWEIAADHNEDDPKWRAHIAAHEAHRFVILSTAWRMTTDRRCTSKPVESRYLIAPAVSKDTAGSAATSQRKLSTAGPKKHSARHTLSSLI